MEALMWLAQIKESRKGNEGARQMVEAENEIRREAGLPSVEELAI